MRNKFYHKVAVQLGVRIYYGVVAQLGVRIKISLWLIFTANDEVLLLSKGSESDRGEITKRVTEAKLLSR